MKAMILAAGKNTRLKGFENGCPKVLLKVHGRTILERNLIYLKKAGFKEVVVNLHYQSGLIRDFLEKNNHGLRIHFSYEKTLMGTAGALKLVREKFRGRACLVLYGDNLTDIPLKKMIQFHRARKAKITLGMYRPTETLWSGIAAGMIQTDVQGRITAFLEKRSNQSVSAAEWVNAGVLVVSPSI